MMNAGDIAFPHLGIYLENVPRSFSVFGFEIAFYGLIIGIGVLAGILMAVHQAKVTGENPDTIWDFAIYAVIFSVIGARIYYVVFAWDYYKDNLLSIFNTRNGGMAIYGGVIGAFLTLFIYCRIKKINPFRLGDLCVPGLILGQVIGRWGNFMNRSIRGIYGQFSGHAASYRSCAQTGYFSECSSSHYRGDQLHPGTSHFPLREPVEPDDPDPYAGVPQVQEIRWRDLSAVLRRLWSWQILDRRYPDRYPVYPRNDPRRITGIILVHGDLRSGDGRCGTYPPGKTAESGKILKIFKNLLRISKQEQIHRYCVCSYFYTRYCSKKRLCRMTRRFFTWSCRKKPLDFSCKIPYFSIKS